MAWKLLYRVAIANITGEVVAGVALPWTTIPFHTLRAAAYEWTWRGVSLERLEYSHLPRLCSYLYQPYWPHRASLGLR